MANDMPTMRAVTRNITVMIFHEGCHKEYHGDDREHAALELQSVLEELYDRVYQIAKQPCDEKWQ